MGGELRNAVLLARKSTDAGQHRAQKTVHVHLTIRDYSDVVTLELQNLLRPRRKLGPWGWEIAGGE